MQIEVLLFGPQAAMAQRDRVTLEVADPRPTTAAVKQALRDALPQLAPSLDQSRLAVNCAYVGEDEQVDAADEIALIGMVSGG